MQIFSLKNIIQISLKLNLITSTTEIVIIAIPVIIVIPVIFAIPAIIAIPVIIVTLAIIAIIANPAILVISQKI